MSIISYEAPTQTPDMTLTDRTQVADGGLPREQLIHSTASGPKVLKVYSRRKGIKGNSG
jgi:hypothetical protein